MELTKNVHASSDILDLLACLLALINKTAWVSHHISHRQVHIVHILVLLGCVALVIGVFSMMVDELL